MDIVGFSVLSMKEQVEALSKLQETVQKSDLYVAARENDGEFRSIPTGDGMALVFSRYPEATVRCAVDVSRSLRNVHQVKVRMGIHVGPVIPHSDINASSNVLGGGINYAQRVMDQGDAGHILVSGSMVDQLKQIGGWNEHLKDLGETEIKHGERIHLYLLHGVDFGNAEVPTKTTRNGFKNGFRRGTPSVVPFQTTPLSRRRHSISQPFQTTPEFSRRPIYGGLQNKAWYRWLDPDGRECFLAFVNAKGSCSLRVFDGVSGRFLGKRYDSGNFQDAFSKYLEGALQLDVSRQPNLERECKDRLPEDILGELQSQVPSKGHD